MAHILIVEDEKITRTFLASVLAEAKHDVIEAEGVQEALKTLAAKQLDLVITDQRLPDGEGLSLLSASREIDATLPVVLLTAYASVELAVEAMRQGAYDFVAKPFVPEEVLAVVRRACEHTAFSRENEQLKQKVRQLQPVETLIGKSPTMCKVKEQIAQVAPTQATVLITGETGTGKELVARAVHQHSQRAEKPFMAVNCAALPENLLESELFGHEKGAFTGASQTRKGLFEAAHEGTLFLDEAGEMSLTLQAKLLRVLTDHEVIRVGATTPRSVDVRILVATHRNLQQRMKEGAFREDLYFRLAVIPVVVPPLRRRREDIPLLVTHFLKLVAHELKVPQRTINPQALELLIAYSFPGNVRELRNLIERAYILAKKFVITPEDFPLITESEPGPADFSTPTLEEIVHLRAASMPQPLDLKEAVEKFEQTLVFRALEGAGGVQAEAARNLGISRSDIAYKIKKYGLQIQT